MNRMLFSCVGVCLVAAGCTAHPPALARDTGRAVASVESGAPEESRKFDIPAEDVTVAVPEWSEQGRTKVLFDFSAVRGRQTHAVEGTLLPAQALKSMLMDTGLSFRYVNENTVAITTDR